MVHYSFLLRLIVFLYFFFTSLSFTYSQESLSTFSPHAHLGFSPGDDRTIADWQQITSYFTKLDQFSNRVVVRKLGESTLKSPLIAAFISSPENIRKLSKYKDIQRKLADPRLISSEAERSRLIEQGRTIVVISCSIHSTEIVASQMSMQLAYDLATAHDASALEILQNTIIILIPSANPDGINIVANWYRKTLGTPYEGTYPPELYHHYAGHDNNRDWFMLNLKETQILTNLFWKEWFPQIVYDIHQQTADGPRLVLPPFHDPANPHIEPTILRELGLLGYKMAADAQAAGIKGVVTNAVYDTWWHGGFRSAPYYHNSIGVLSEMASAKLMTPMTISQDTLDTYTSRGISSVTRPTTNFPDPWPAGIWRPRDIMQAEMVITRALLSMAAKFRTRYLSNFYKLGHKAINPNITSIVAYMIPAKQYNQLAATRMIDVLINQGVEIYKLKKAVPAKSFDKEIMLEPESFLIFLSQPYRANVQALFERQVYPETRDTNGNLDRPYDVAGWTLPMQMGVTVIPIIKFNTIPTAKDMSIERRGSISSTLISNPILSSIKIGIYKSWKPSMDEGWTRFVFDTFNIPYQSIRDEEIRKGDLRSKYYAIILPSQPSKDILEGNKTGTYPPEYTGGISEIGLKNLRQFAEEGGTLLCFNASSELAIKRFNLPVKNVLEGLSITEFFCPGSIISLELDPQHKIALNLPQDVNVYFTSSIENNMPSSYAFQETDSERVNVIARYAKSNVLQSGWLVGEERIKGKAALVEVKINRGKIYLFGFRPQHRGQTWGTFQLIFNTINSSTRSN
jgi:hypothetical protein